MEKLTSTEKVARELSPYLDGVESVVFVEEGILNGGFSMICEREINKISSAETDIAAIEDNFANPSEKCDLYDFVGLSAEKIANKMISLIK